MKALSLKQPFAELIRIRRKPIETRLWATSYRGDLLICATKVAYPGEIEEWIESGVLHPPVPNGVSRCVARLVDCREMSHADEEDACCAWQPGRFAWVLEDIRPTKSIPITGARRLFEVPDALIEYEESAP